MSDQCDSKAKEYAKLPCNGCGKRQVVFEGDNTDVDILQRACLKFGNLLLSTTGDEISAVDVQKHNITTRFGNGVDPFSASNAAADY